jgi:HlyD family secretion protein
MNDMIFQGRVDESEVGGLRDGMPVGISVGALRDQRFEGRLEYVAPKGWRGRARSNSRCARR